MSIIQLAYVLSVVAVVLAGLAHWSLTWGIHVAEKAANAKPPRLRGGMTRADALAQVAKWRQMRKNLWFLTALVIAGGIAFAHHLSP